MGSWVLINARWYDARTARKMPERALTNFARQNICHNHIERWRYDDHIHLFNNENIATIIFNSLNWKKDAR
jgi:hypothetical protein